MARANIIMVNRSMGWIIIIMIIIIMIMIIMMNNVNIWNKNSRIIIIDLMKDLWWMKRINRNGEINNSNLV